MGERKQGTTLDLNQRRTLNNLLVENTNNVSLLDRGTAQGSAEYTCDKGFSKTSFSLTGALGKVG